MTDPRGRRSLTHVGGKVARFGEAKAAEMLANDETWPMLYDVEKLRQNTVPVAAAVYYDDMYVPRIFSEETW